MKKIYHLLALIALWCCVGQVKADVTVTTYDDLVTALAGSDPTIIVDGTITVTEQLNVTRAVTIKGNPGNEIIVNNGQSAFSLTANVTIDGINFTGSYNGRAIAGGTVEGNVYNVNNCKFYHLGNSSTTGNFNGGAVSLNHATIANSTAFTANFSNCQFIECQTSREPSTNKNGGAIWINRGGTTNIYNCLFYGNKQTYNGVGSSVGCNNGAVINVYNSIFIGGTSGKLDVQYNGTTSSTNLSAKNCITDKANWSAFCGGSTTGTDIQYSKTATDCFTDANSGDFTPPANFSGKDAGTTSGITLPATDIAGNTRIVGSAVDIGPYEDQTLPSKITYDANGGDDVKNATVLLAPAGVAYPGASHRAGYIFAGWYEQSSPNPATDTPVLFPYVPAVSGDITLYAGWIAETDYNNSSNFTTYQSRVIRNSVFDKNTKIKDIAMLGAHCAFTAKCVVYSAKTQELSGYQLAQRGVRIFDTRVMLDVSTWKTHHGTKTVGIYTGEKNQPMADDIADVLKFADENPGEVIILYLWPKESIDLGETSNLASFWSTLEAVKYNGKTLSDFMNYSNTTALKDLTYGDVTDDGTKAGIVIFALDDNASGQSHNAYYLGANVVANNYENNTDAAAAMANVGVGANFADANRLRVSWCQKYNNGTLNIANYVDAWNVQFTNNANLKTWLATSPILMFDFINHTNAFSSAFNMATQRYNIGEPNLAVSNITINAANVNITSAVSTKTGETDITLATDGSATEVPDAATRKIEITFTLPAGNHDPYVSVNGEKVTPVANYPITGSYYLSVVGVEEDKNIQIYSYAANVIPASADTYINNGTGSTTADNSASPTLTVQSSTGSYKRAAVMRFVLTDELKAQYSKAELRMVFKQAQASKDNKDNTIVPTSVTATTTNFSAINWSSYSSAYDATTNRIGATFNYNFGSPSNAIKNLPFTFDISDYVFSSANDFQVALSGTTVGDGSFFFYSLEGGVGEYVPQLVLSGAPRTFTVTTTLGTGVTANSIPASQTTDYLGANLDTEFTLESGYHSPYVSVDGQYLPVTRSGSNYSFSLGNIYSDKAIVIKAFPANVIPVSADTYIYDGREPDTSNPSNTTSPYDPIHYLDTDLYIRNNGTSTQRHIYLKFDKSQFPADYNKVTLRLYHTGTNLWTDNYVVNVYPQYATWNETTLHGKNEPTQLTSPTVTFSLPTLASTVLTAGDADTERNIELTDALLSAGTNGNDVSLRLYATSPGNCHIRFASLENGNADYVPVLVFSQPALKVPATQTVSANNYITTGDNANGDLIFYEGGQLLDATNFTPANGVVKVVKTFNVNEWYPVGFPFEIDTVIIKQGTSVWGGVIYNEDNDEIVTTSPANISKATYDNYFVTYYDGVANRFKFTDKFEADHGYNIEFPEDPFTAGTVEVTFVAKSGSTVSSSGRTVTNSGGYFLLPNPNVSNATTLASSNAYYQYEYGNNHFGIVGSYSFPAATLSTPLKPFEAIVSYVGSTSGSLRSSIGTGDVTDIEPIVGDAVVSARYYTLQGIEVAKLEKGNVYIEKRGSEVRKIVKK